MTESPKVLQKNFRDMLMGHIGKDFTLVNPESYEETGIGHHLVPNWYPCKLVAVGDDFVVVVGQFKHGAGKHATKEPMEQYIPLSHVKRVSIMHSGRLLHV